MAIERRTFLQSLGAAALGGTAAAQQPSGRKTGYAIVGLGRLAQNQILPAFAKCRLSRPTALVSGDPAKAARLAAQYGVNAKSIYNYQNYDQLASNPDVDVVYVVLPNGMHAEYTIRASKAGKHVLCEKPMANTPNDCRRMIDAARSAGRKLMVAYRCRYEPYNMTAIKMVREGEIGPLKVIITDHGFNIQQKEWRLDKKS